MFVTTVIERTGSSVLLSASNFNVSISSLSYQAVNYDDGCLMSDWKQSRSSLQNQVCFSGFNIIFGGYSTKLAFLDN
jgi:hypothetical protein